MTRSDWLALERGLVAGTVTAALMRELLRLMARRWFTTFENVDGVPSPVMEIRVKVDLSKLQGEESK